MINAWNTILSHVARKLSDASGSTVEPSDLTAPPDAKFGDLAFGCFTLAQKQKTSPAKFAQALAEKIAKLKKDDFILSAAAFGPYLNVTLQSDTIVALVVKDVEAHQTSFGSSDDGNGRLLMLEYAQPNTHKEFHVGHLRNLVLGNALARILARDGWKVVTASYHGDAGAHVAKCLWMLEKKQAEGGRRQRMEKAGKYLGALYTEATKLLDEHPELKKEVSEVQRKLEAGDPKLTTLWHKTRQWSLAEFDRIFADLGTHIDRQYFESEVMQDGQKIVDELLKKKIAKESLGAIVVDLDAEGLGVFLLRKSDGTSLYATKDLALARLKAKEYPDLARSLMLVDNRQTLYFKQLFRTLELMGIAVPQAFVGFELVTLQSGAMSSREGTIVTYDAFRQEMLAYAREETAQRHPDWSKQKIEKVAVAVAVGGMKYGMLKQDPNKVIIFDLQRALAFDGDTGPYIQYAATRLAGILKKAGVARRVSRVNVRIEAGAEPAEKYLALHIAQFPAALHRAALECKPNEIAQWCFIMAQRVNGLYRDVNILESPETIRASRLHLIKAALSTLLAGLEILGIPFPKGM